MEGLISVIIMDGDERVYFMRCLNAIRRQSYQEVEILFVGTKVPEEAGRQYGDYHIRIVTVPEPAGQGERLNRAVAEAKGKYLFFCTMTSVPASNVLEELMKRAGNNEICAGASYMLPEGKHFVPEGRAAASVYGKLLKKEIMEEHNLRFRGSGDYMQERFLLEYLCFFRKSYTDEKLYIYESNKGLFEKGWQKCGKEKISGEEAADLLSLLKGSALEKKQLFLCDLLEYCYPGDGAETAGLTEMVLKAADILNREREVHAALAGRYVKQWHMLALTEGKESLYETVKKYLNYFEWDRDYLRVILGICGIGEMQYESMQRNDLAGYLFYAEHLPKGNDMLQGSLLSKGMEEMMEELADLRRQVEEGKERMDSLADAEGFWRREGNAGERPGSMGSAGKLGLGMQAPISGAALADYVVGEYGRGGLGMKTILKSVKAWIKYKF